MIYKWFKYISCPIKSIDIPGELGSIYEKSSIFFFFDKISEGITDMKESHMFIKI